MVGAATVKERPPYVFRLNLGNQGDNDYNVDDLSVLRARLVRP